MAVVAMTRRTRRVMITLAVASAAVTVIAGGAAAYMYVEARRTVERIMDEEKGFMPLIHELHAYQSCNEHLAVRFQQALLEALDRCDLPPEKRMGRKKWAELTAEFNLRTNPEARELKSRQPEGVALFCAVVTQGAPRRERELDQLDRGDVMAQTLFPEACS
jgi:hypothetical protein